jgi:DNA-binding NtrC family response regulator
MGRFDESSPPHLQKTSSNPEFAHFRPTGFDAAHRALRRHLRFDPETGQILLFDQRMLLFHGLSFGTLRRELIERIGMDRAREMFTRLGYQQGVDDAVRTRRVAENDASEAWLLGPPLREIEGFVRNEPIGPIEEALRFDAERGLFFGDFYWTSSWEADAHLRHIGVSGVPACWLMIGYATGYTTTLMGRAILWREQECVAMGYERCHVVGRPLEEWPDADEDCRFLQLESFVAVPRGLPAARSTPAPAASATPAATTVGELLGASAAFNAVVHLLRRVADTDATVLFLGESGVGKELFSRTLHAIGPRAAKPLVAVNCAAIPADLVEAELFGVERGAFTGAVSSRPGRFERADGGTLFLDEVSSLPLPAQGRLLRALQQGEIERVGDRIVRRVDVRIVAAANRDLRAEVRAGRFREDLFFRLNVFPIAIPPLRDRREDVPLLVGLFLERATKRFGKSVRGLTIAASQRLRDYDWPGNVRELENLIERAVILVEPGGTIDVQHLFTSGETVRDSSQSFFASEEPTLREAAGVAATTEAAVDGLLAAHGSFEAVEAQFLRRALERCEGNVSAAARLLGLRRGQVEYRLGRVSGRKQSAPRRR